MGRGSGVHRIGGRQGEEREEEGKIGGDEGGLGRAGGKSDKEGG